MTGGTQRPSWGTGVVVVVVVASIAVGPVMAGATATADVSQDNEAPLADAGLDQDVVRNQTVYLDATGSYDPDGEIDGYAWEIERPDGSTTTPECRDCPRTEFYPQQVGRYNVTVTVTDDDGAQRSDTLYVDVDEPAHPEVSLSGPTTVSAGTTATLTADAMAEGTDLARVRWHVDGQEVSNATLDGRTATPTLDRGFSAGEHTVRVEVVDRLGRSASATHSLTVETVASPDPSPDDPSQGNSPSPTPTDGGQSPVWQYLGRNIDSANFSCYAQEGDMSCFNDDQYDFYDGEGEVPRSIVVRDPDDDGRITVNGETFTVGESGRNDETLRNPEGDVLAHGVRVTFAELVNAHSDDVSEGESENSDTGNDGATGSPGGHTDDGPRGTVPPPPPGLTPPDDTPDTWDRGDTIDNRNYADVQPPTEDDSVAGDESTSAGGDDSTSESGDDDEWDRGDTVDSGNYSELRT